MENCTIYSHYLNFDKIVELAKSNNPKAKIEFTESGEHKQLTILEKGGLFSKDKVLRISYRQRLNPSYQLQKVECPLTQNLAGMCQFIQSLPASNEQIKQLLIHKVTTLNCEIGIVAEPKLTPSFVSLLSNVAKALDAILFVPPGNAISRSDTQHFLDADLNLILDTKGHSEVDQISIKVESKYKDQPHHEYTDAQLNRKEASENILKEHGVKINYNLPCSPDVSSITLRNEKEVVERVYALVILAARGEGVPIENLNKAITDKGIIGFSPKEKFIIDKGELDDNEKAYATWRYESLTVLLWALGYLPELSFPSTICDVQQIVGTIIQPSREDFESKSKLRSTGEILNMLDQIYRMNWACVDARINNAQPSGNIHPGIVYERHYALNWLTNYQDQDWDDVSTDT